jgi:hypothetical protein
MGRFRSWKNGRLSMTVRKVRNIRRWSRDWKIRGNCWRINESSLILQLEMLILKSKIYWIRKEKFKIR